MSTERGAHQLGEQVNIQDGDKTYCFIVTELNSNGTIRRMAIKEPARKP